MLTFYKDTFKTSFYSFFFYIFSFIILTTLFVCPPLYLLFTPIVSFISFLVFHFFYVYVQYRPCFALLQVEINEGLSDNLVSDYESLSKRRKSKYEAINDRINIAQIYISRNNPSAALNILSDIYQKYSDNFDIPTIQISYNYTLLTAKLKAGFNISFNEISRIISDADDSKTQSDDLETLKLYMQAVYYNKQYEYEKAIECLNKKISMTHKYNYKFKVNEMLADTYLEYVVSYSGLGQYNMATKYLDYAKQYSKTNYLIARINKAQYFVNSAKNCA